MHVYVLYSRGLEGCVYRLWISLFYLFTNFCLLKNTLKTMKEIKIRLIKTNMKIIVKNHFNKEYLKKKEVCR